jgi:hypothetical protein
VIFLYNEKSYAINSHIILVKFCLLKPYLNDFLDQFVFGFVLGILVYIGCHECHA